MIGLLLLAAEAAAPPPAGVAGGWFSTLLRNSFYLALIALFLVAVVAAFIAARKRDRCLKKFGKFHVTLAEQAGRHIWGRLKVFSKGLELVYDEPHERPAKNSFLVYEGDLGKVLAIYRFADRLTEKHAKRRAKQADKLATPPVRTRLWRWIRNIVNTFRDAIVKAMGMSVQQAATARPNPILQSQGGQINAIGTMIIGETANAYEPMLEQYIGDPVILEVVNPADPQKRIVEYYGHLGEYSAQFVLLVDVVDRFHEDVPLEGGARRVMEQKLLVRPDDGAVHVENGSAVEVVVEGVTVAGVCHEMNRKVAPGETADVPLPEGIVAGSPEGDATPAVVNVSFERRFEMIVPRACGIIRHASEEPEA